MDRCQHSPVFGPGTCRFCAIIVEEYYEKLMRRDRVQSPATSANLLIRHYQEYVSQEIEVDLEKGVVADDMPLVPIVKIEDILQDDKDTRPEENAIPPQESHEPEGNLIPPQESNVQRGSFSTIRRALSAISELPPTFVLGSFVLLVITIIILFSFVVSLYSRAGEILLTFYLLRAVIEWVRRPLSYD